MIKFFLKNYYRDIGYWVAIILYGALTFRFIFEAGMNMDAAQSWLMARDSKNLIELYRIAPWSGHPFLWSFILFPFARLDFHYHVVPILNWLIMLGVVWIFLFRAPFCYFVKYSFVFSYFIMWEYFLGGRDYGLTTLLLFLIASIFHVRFDRPFFYGILIFLLFNSLYLVFPIAFILMILYSIEAFRWRNAKVS